MLSKATRPGLGERGWNPQVPLDRIHIVEGDLASVVLRFESAAGI